MQNFQESKFDELVKSSRFVTPVPDHVRDDGSGIQNILKLLDSGSLIGVRDKLRRNDGKTGNSTFYEAIKISKLRFRNTRFP
jgi:hypothetical protein